MLRTLLSILWNGIILVFMIVYVGGLYILNLILKNFTEGFFTTVLYLLAAFWPIWVYILWKIYKKHKRNRDFSEKFVKRKYKS